MTPSGALAALRGAEARDGALPLDRRRDALASMAATVLRRADEVAAAVDADYGGRSVEETLLAEVMLVANAARHARGRLRRWARPRRVPAPFYALHSAQYLEMSFVLMALHAERFRPLPEWGLWARLPLQPLLMWLVWRAGRRR